MEHDYEYTARDGRCISIKPNESYILVSKTSDHWWHVRKDLDTKPFYIPAQYVREGPAATRGPQDPYPGFLTDREPVDVPTTRSDGETRTRLYSVGTPKDTCQFSTFGFSENLPDVKLYERTETPTGQNSTRSAVVLHSLKRHSSGAAFSFTSKPLDFDGISNHTTPPPLPEHRGGLSFQPSAGSPLTDEVELPKSSLCQIKTLGDNCIQFPVPESSVIYETVPDFKTQELGIPFKVVAGAEAAANATALQHKSLDHSSGSACTPDPPSKAQVTFLHCLIFSL